MSFIVDAKMSKWSAAALSILTKHCDRIVRTANHAKGFLLSNAEWRVSVISSANFSNNPRIEGGCISTNPVVFDMHREWIEQLLHQRGSVPGGDRAAAGSSGCRTRQDFVFDSRFAGFGKIDTGAHADGYGF
ncbi:MAG: hypothetical protein V8T86_06415 [Victivallis sp.]